VEERTAVAATFTYRHEADFACQLLHDSGIDAVLVADDGGGAYPGVSLSGRVRVLVRASDLETAQEVLGATEKPGIDADETVFDEDADVAPDD